MSVSVRIAQNNEERVCKYNSREHTSIRRAHIHTHITRWFYTHIACEYPREYAFASLRLRGKLTSMNFITEPLATFIFPTTEPSLYILTKCKKSKCEEPGIYFNANLCI